MIKKLGPYLLIPLLLLITFNLWLSSKSNLTSLWGSPLRSLSQIVALLGLILIALNLFLSTKIFKELDKIYNLHHLLGSIAFIMVLNHPLLLAISVLPQKNLALLYLLPSTDLSYSLGVFALYAMIFSFVFMVFIKLPYHLWKTTHQALGLAFLFMSGHALLISSDLSSFYPLRLWVMSFLGLGIASSFYTIFLYPRLGQYRYRLEKIERVLDIVILSLSPLGKVLKFSPGQFAYFKFNDPVLGREAHPFSFASSPREKMIRICAKVVGDYTLNLSLLNTGTQVRLTGPYGKFGAEKKGNLNSLWLAGGIGVTPFLSMLQSYLPAGRQAKPQGRKIDFYYSFRKREEGVFASEIRETVKKIPEVNFVEWCSYEKGRLTALSLAKQIDFEKIDQILLCGPTLMMESLNQQFINLGVSKEKIYFENFSFL